MKFWYIYGKTFTKYLHGIWSLLGVDRLSAWPIIGADIKHLPIIDIGHFKNRFADNFFFLLLLFFLMQTNILFTGDIIYWWINNTGESI